MKDRTLIFLEIWLWVLVIGGLGFAWLMQHLDNASNSANAELEHLQDSLALYHLATELEEGKHATADFISFGIWIAGVTVFIGIIVFFEWKLRTLKRE